MHPGADERLARRRLRLGDLVLVVREHRSMPPVWMSKLAPRYLMLMAEHSICQPGRPGADLGVPARLARRGPFQSAKSRTSSLLYSSASTRSPTRCCVGIEAGQRAIAGQRRDAEEDRAVVGPVGVAALDERGDERGHVRDVIGGVRQHVGIVTRRRIQVGQERAVCRAVSSPIVMPASDASRMILSSTSVMFITQVTRCPSIEVSAQQIGEQEAAEVAHVRRRIDRRAAAVHADVPGVDAARSPRGRCPACCGTGASCGTTVTVAVARMARPRLRRPPGCRSRL